MSTVQLLPWGLALHLTGITMMVGTFLAAYFNSRQLWRHLPHELEKAHAVSKATSRYMLWQMMGGLFILAGGILMMVAVHGLFMHQIWFQVKMALLVLLIGNAAITARPAAKKLKRMLAGQAGNLDGPTMVQTEKRLTLFYVLQLGLFLTIIILSAFKFN